MDSMLFTALAGPLMGMASLMFAGLVFAPVVLYVIARWRAHREPTGDHQIGIKFALHYFAISGFQLALAGGALLLYTLISPGGSELKGGGYRSAFGLLLPAAIVLGVHLSLLKRTNDDEQPSVKRLFAGYNLLVTGLLGFIALVLGFQAMFAKGSTGGMGHLGGAMILVYGTAWAVLGWRFGQLVLGGNGFAASGPPDLGMHGGYGAPGAPGMPGPQVPPAGAPPAQGGTGLPPLGGGSYPPIEPR